MHWLNFKRYKSDVAKQAVPPHLNAAEFARHYADKPQENTEEYLSLSGEMCWDAVVLCAHRSGALSKAKYKQLWLTVFDKQYRHFVSPDDTEIRTMADMLRAPQGCFIGIFSMRDAASPRLLHAMIGTGAGFAAGNKNLCIGVGGAVGWENLNLARDLRWQPEGGFLRQGDSEVLRIFYRPFPA
ncbi:MULTISPECIES: hypothetical protein [Serratia]|uniref:Uncharacterized protein n=1 Tax=Serratia ureilytica TaxID=300181 RepID=A0ABU0VFZ3_9GAMM|nr:MULTISPECIES: hypothetical protein [Serratia]ALD43076.1 hypothetical protein AN479_01050 [Serratia marcescens]ASL92312.1 hypothetical protein BVG94_06455 [Serratia marcescens]AYU89966.1 hypothetical protein EDY99_06285 [Serratia sp. LS-1]MBH1924292.1 hypothetical protein [Serratia ureilytica]MBH2540208.1 hypothetical protein [Serratia ureilytica]